MEVAKACVAQAQAKLPAGKRCHTEVLEAQTFWPAEEMHRAPQSHHTPTAVTRVTVTHPRRVLTPRAFAPAQSNTCKRAGDSATRSRQARAVWIAFAAMAENATACRERVYGECACAARLTGARVGCLDMPGENGGERSHVFTRCRDHVLNLSLRLSSFEASSVSGVCGLQAHSPSISHMARTLGGR